LPYPPPRRPVVAVLVALSVAAICGPSSADTINPWAAFRDPATGPAQAIGAYRAGCVQGAAQLPRRGKGFRVMRPERARVFGHPRLIAFIRSLARSARRKQLAPLAIGDLGQARGGPAPSGHSSHQSGLDVDIWYAAKGRGARARPVLMVDRKRLQPTAAWNGRATRLLALAAADPAVDRIFVHPVLKRALCASARGDRAWLRKLRPWWGHDDHFHVRLACPPDSPSCEAQARLPAGDGCADLAWWFRPASDGERRERKQAYQERVGTASPLPTQCAALLR
jgi:penicillin-insensitive murein endopeptidase